MELSLSPFPINSSTSDTPEKCPICQQNAEKICSGCSSVFYCSSDHQKQDWKLHKLVCRPYIIKKNEAVGRYLVAARDLSQGTIIMTETPLVVGPKRITHAICLSCHKRVDCSYKCSKCTFPMCNQACENHPLHAQNECPIFQKGHPIGSRINDGNTLHPAYEAVMPLRCLLLRSKDPARWTKLNTMEHHNEVRRTLTAMWNRNEVNTIKLLRDWFKLKDEFDSDTIHTCIGYVDVNCFEIKYKDIEICGMYPEASLMCHDCTPNTHHATTQGPHFRMIVRTSVPIRKGEIISTSYVEALKTTIERRRFLKVTKYFDCICARCKDATEFGTMIAGVKCGSCTNGYLLPKDPLSPIVEEQLDAVLWQCNNSSEQAPSCPNAKYGKIKSILGKVKKEIESADGCSSGSRISRLEKVLKKFSGKVLHPNHSLLLEVMKNLSKIYLDNNLEEHQQETFDKLQRKRELCLQLLHVLDLVDSGLSRPRGVTLYHLYTAELPIAKIQLAKGDLAQDEFEGKLVEILSYLKTAKETLDLDRLIVDHPKLALDVDAAIDLVYEVKSLSAK